MFTTLEKERVFDRVTATVLRDESLRDLPQEARCVFFGIETVRAIREMLGARAVLQAGSAGWPRLRPDQDDGKADTHFSYVWSPQEAPSRILLAQGRMPEVHVWAALPREREIVDLTAGLWPDQAARFGYDWPGDRPPRYFWGGAQHLPAGAYYRAEREAIMFVLGALVALVGESGIRNLA